MSATIIVHPFAGVQLIKVEDPPVSHWEPPTVGSPEYVAYVKQCEQQTIAERIQIGCCPMCGVLLRDGRCVVAYCVCYGQKGEA